jgi:hypothetical protein
MMLHPKKILLIAVVLLLSACSFLDLKPSIERDMAGKDLPSRFSVLEKACTEHASNPHGRKEEKSDSGSVQYKLSTICHKMGIKIVEANSAAQPLLLRKVFSELATQCDEEGSMSKTIKDNQV